MVNQGLFIYVVKVNIRFRAFEQRVFNIVIKVKKCILQFLKETHELGTITFFTQKRGH